MFPNRDIAGALRTARREFLKHYQNFRYGSVDADAPLGRRGEQAAARLLRQKKLQVIAHSESDQAGEIDLVAVDAKNRTFVFVEVKTLATTKPGHPADRVDANKQRRIARAALRYLKRKHLLGQPCRFDVIAVWWPADHECPERIEHYASAFESPLVESFY